MKRNYYEMVVSALIVLGFVTVICTFVALLNGCTASKEVFKADRTPQQRLNDLKILVIATNKQIAADVREKYMTPTEGQDLLYQTRHVSQNVKNIESLSNLISPDVDKRISALETQMFNLRDYVAKEAAAARAEKEGRK